jgi:hypothetical protein
MLSPIVIFNFLFRRYKMKDLKIYLFRYFYKGSWSQIEIPAISREDAEDRIRCIISAEYEDVMQFEYSFPAVN